MTFFTHLYFISFSIGALHFVAPDHWIPASLLVWRRGWTLLPTLLMCIGISLIHMSLGALLFFVMNLFGSHPLDQIGSHSDALFIFSVIIVGSSLLFRLLRQRRIRQVFRFSQKTPVLSSLLTLLSLMGPAESLIPLLLKAKVLGTGFTGVLGFYFLGTFLASVALVDWGRRHWDDPYALPRIHGSI